jgi:hypothetical protein
MIEMERFCCGQCGIEFYVPPHFARECREKGSDKTWYCPNGHPRVFRQSEADKLRQERDRLQQRIAQKDDEIAAERRRREDAERRTSAARGQVTKMKNRASAGVCPCCNRTFKQLAAHMKTKHPGFMAEPIEGAEAATH